MGSVQSDLHLVSGEEQQWDWIFAFVLQMRSEWADISGSNGGCRCLAELAAKVPFLCYAQSYTALFSI